MKPIMLNAVIYLRVSDASQLDNNSLETQEKTCREKAKQLGAQVLKVFKDEAKSAKHVDTRPALRDLLVYCVDKSKKITHVIVYKVDRWTRNVAEGLGAETILSKRGIELISAVEGFDNSPTGNFVKTVLMAIGQMDNELKGLRVRDNMKTMFKKGLWCWKPPIGYKRQYATKEQNKGIPPIIDIETGEIIRTLFQEAVTGIYSRSQLISQANKRGLERAHGHKLTQALLDKILRNPFYYGLMYSKKWDLYHEGLHEPLISEKTWNEVQYRIYGKKRAHSVQDSAKYPLKGLLHCELCGHLMTSSNPRGNTKTYYHYECGNAACRKTRINVDEAQRQFFSILDTLKPSDRVLRLFEDMVV